MNDHETLLTAAWEEWHFGVDPEIMPQPNASFKAGFNAGLVAAHELHCKALVRVDELQAAIEKTLSENGHLADGENCTLIDLRRVIRGDFSPWNEIDYNDPSTYPDENRPCIVAWENHPEHPDRHAMHVFNDAGDDVRLWQNVLSDEVHDWDGTTENPTHWMYAPEHQP